MLTADISLPAGFGISTGRATGASASSSKALNKVSISQPALKRSSPKKTGVEKRKPKEPAPQQNKKLKTMETTSEFPYDAPVTAAGDWFAKVADGYVEPGKFKLWQQRNGEQAADACRRAAAELFFHLTCNPSDTEKLRARLDAANEEKAKLKEQLAEAERDKAELEKFKSGVERDISRLKADADNLRADLNKTAQELTASSEKVASLESTVEDLHKQLDEAERTSFVAGFRSYVTGFLAVDPDYDWGKFVPATRDWIEEFKVAEAEAIEEKRLAIELEAASASAQKFLQQNEDEARQEGDDEADANNTNPIP